MKATRDESKLTKVLESQGITFKRLYYYSCFAWQPERGWWLVYEDGFETMIGKTTEIAAYNIEHGLIEVPEEDD